MFFSVAMVPGIPQFQSTSRGSDIFIERLREKVQSAAIGVKDASKHLHDLAKVKQHARAQIRDAERLLKMSEQKEQQVKTQLVIFKSEVCKMVSHVYRPVPRYLATAPGSIDIYTPCDFSLTHTSRVGASIPNGIYIYVVLYVLRM